VRGMPRPKHSSISPRLAASKAPTPKTRRVPMISRAGLLHRIVNARIARGHWQGLQIVRQSWRSTTSVGWSSRMRHERLKRRWSGGRGRVRHRGPRTPATVSFHSWSSPKRPAIPIARADRHSNGNVTRPLRKPAWANPTSPELRCVGKSSAAHDEKTTNQIKTGFLSSFPTIFVQTGPYSPRQHLARHETHTRPHCLWLDTPARFRPWLRW